MTTKELYKRAKTNGVEFISSCVGISQYQWDELMKGATRANKKLAAKVAHQAGVIDEFYLKQELRRPYFNPYNHFKTKDSIIYVHSGIEYFIRIN